MSDQGGVSGPRAVRFAEAPLEPEAPGIASEAIEISGVRWAAVRYEPGVLREEWCEEGHSGYVVEGTIEYEFREGHESIALSPGEGFTLPDGADGAHRGRAGADGVRLFLIDRAG